MEAPPDNDVLWARALHFQHDALEFRDCHRSIRFVIDAGNRSTDV